MRCRAAEGAPGRRIDGPLAWFAGAVIAVSAAGVALGAVLLQAGPAPRDGVAIAVAGIRAEVPAAWLRARSGDGAALVLAPGDLGLEIEGQAEARLLVHLGPADEGPDPAERPTHLYARFLSPEASASPGDLVRREFRAGTPFEGETLYLAPPDGRGFSARCAARAAPGPAECAAAFRLRGAEVRVGLPSSLLPYGPALVERLTARLGGP